MHQIAHRYVGTAKLGVAAVLTALTLFLAPGWLDAQSQGASGSLDGAFGNNGMATAFGSGSEARAVALQPDGRIVVAGTVSNGGDSDIGVARFTSSGSLDTSFSGDGKVDTDVGSNSNDYGEAVALQADGKIVVAGRSGGNIVVMRLTSSGTLDTTFDGDGIATTNAGSDVAAAYGVAVQPDGKIVAAGLRWAQNESDVVVARFTSSGSLDTTFGNNGIAITDIDPGTKNDRGYSVALQPDGKIVVGGRSNASGLDDFMVLRYTSAGAPDTSFGGDGVVTTSSAPPANDYGEAIALQEDGKIVVAGYSFDNILIQRYTAAGAVDDTFNRGRGVFDFVTSTSVDQIYAVAVQRDGKIVVAGLTEGDILLARYTHDGFRDSLVRTRVGSGAAAAYGMALQPDDKIIVVGKGDAGFVVLRYHARVGGL